ncbi:hypothetical protein SIN8267_02195 [Sinobacterium norvegicum]|uniref:NnrS family protein n=1 Tax=Sinobacterium norvegicum TaxID=1641715 RepID=A0ABM9AG31_9GAMM|nr:NnrS family protein [Sinobacterium norvegicum]CAH0992080.1 hypothetical protein SIN8267_02195 [Sinobacterium norvegicum]
MSQQGSPFLTIQEPKKNDKQGAKQRLNQRLASDGTLRDKASRPSTRLAISQQPLWDLPFRPWFLLAALSSVASIIAWSLWLNGRLAGDALGGLTPVIWHIHEMLFAFGATVAAGFLLTAAQTWTGKRGMNGTLLIVLSVVWLVVRALLISDNNHALIAAIVVQSVWWLAVIGYLGWMVVSSRNRRNYLFVPLLTTMMLLNIAVLYSDISGNSALALHLSRTAILLFGIIVGIVGGRVIPFFTGRGADQAKVTETPNLDRWILPTAILGTAVFFFGGILSLPLSPAILMIAAGTLHLIRLGYWDSWATRNTPLLWSLHLSYLALGLGLILLGLSYATDAIRFADALHLITVGTIGAMILAMMARVSLGHTGRPLKPHVSINIAFGLILLAAIARVLLPLLGQPLWAWDISAGLWITAFALFLWRYTPILLSQRHDKQQ